MSDVTVVLFEGTKAETRMSFINEGAALNWIYANDYHQDARIVTAPVWSKTNIATGIAETPEGYVLIDERGARIDWPVIETYREAREELTAHKRNLAGANADAASETFGLSRMTAIDTE